MTDLAMPPAIESSAQGRMAMVGADHRVYRGKPENCSLSPEGDAPAYYDNSDHSLQLISDNIKMFHFLYSRDLPMSQREMCREKCFTKADYIEFASLREGVLPRYPRIREVPFAGKPFVPPKAHRRMHRSRRAAPAR